MTDSTQINNQTCERPENGRDSRCLYRKKRKSLSYIHRSPQYRMKAFAYKPIPNDNSFKKLFIARLHTLLPPPRQKRLWGCRSAHQSFLAACRSRWCLHVAQLLPPSLLPLPLGEDVHAHNLPDELESSLALGHLEQLHGVPLDHGLQELGVVAKMPEAPGMPCLRSSLLFGPCWGPKPWESARLWLSNGSHDMKATFYVCMCVFNSLMYFNSKLRGTAQKTDNIKNMYLHVGQLS